MPTRRNRKGVVPSIRCGLEGLTAADYHLHAPLYHTSQPNINGHCQARACVCGWVCGCVGGCGGGCGCVHAWVHPCAHACTLARFCEAVCLPVRKHTCVNARTRVHLLNLGGCARALNLHTHRSPCLNGAPSEAVLATPPCCFVEALAACFVHTLITVHAGMQGIHQQYCAPSALCACTCWTCA